MSSPDSSEGWWWCGKTPRRLISPVTSNGVDQRLKIEELKVTRLRDLGVAQLRKR